jgi:hypothetical protein
MERKEKEKEKENNNNKKWSKNNKSPKLCLGDLIIRSLPVKQVPQVVHYLSSFLIVLGLTPTKQNITVLLDLTPTKQNITVLLDLTPTKQNITVLLDLTPTKQNITDLVKFEKYSSTNGINTKFLHQIEFKNITGNKIYFDRLMSFFF